MREYRIGGAAARGARKYFVREARCRLAILLGKEIVSSEFKYSPDYRLFEYACSLLAADKPTEAIKEFASLHEQHADEFRVVFMLAGSYFEAARFEEASHHFRRAVDMRPTHELSSLLLFHPLWEDERHHEAIEEMDRFIVIQFFNGRDSLNIRNRERRDRIQSFAEYA